MVGLLEDVQAEEIDALRLIIAQMAEKIAEKNKRIITLKRDVADLKKEMGECLKL